VNFILFNNILSFGVFYDLLINLIEYTLRYHGIPKIQIRQNPNQSADTVGKNRTDQKIFGDAQTPFQKTA